MVSQKTGAATRSKIPLTEYLSHHHILLSTPDASESRRLSDLSSLRELHIHGPALPLLNILLDLMGPYSVDTVSLINTPRLLSLREESSARRLNDKASELIVDGLYKDDKSRTLLSKHSLNIHFPFHLPSPSPQRAAVFSSASAIVAWTCILPFSTTLPTL